MKAPRVSLHTDAPGLAGSHPSARGRSAHDLNFWAVFNSAPDAYLLLAPDPPRFTMVAANRARFEATMTQPADVIGRPLFEVFPDNPTDPAATGVKNLEASLLEVIRSRKPHRMALQKYDIRGADGKFEERYWDPLNSPVFDEQGNLVYIIHRVEDVTDDVRARERADTMAARLSEETAAHDQEKRARHELEHLFGQLRESEERYRLLADLIPQFIWTTDPAGYHGYFSQRWYDFTGATLAETAGDKWMQFLHPDDRERTVARWRESLKTGEPYSIEYRFRAHTGEYRWFLGQALPRRDAAGVIIGWFGTLTDISERKRLDEERDAILARERESHDRVATILESITDAFFAVDHDWRFTYVNREAEAILKRPRAELIGRSVWDEFSPAAGSTFETQYQRAMTAHETVKFEAFYQPLAIWVDVRAYPSQEGLSVFFRDISLRKHAEEELRQSEERYRLLIDMIPQHIWTADPDGRITYASRRWYEFTGKTPEQSLGDAWTATLHPDDREPTLERWRHSLRTGEPLSAEYRFRKSTGEYCWFLGKAVPRRNEAGEIVSWFGTLTDISDRKQRDAEREHLLAAEQHARADAERRREDLERVTDSRTRLMRGFTHDVKNPLGAAIGYAKLLEDGLFGALGDEQLQSVHRIEKSIRASLVLINELLELARAEAGQIELESKEVDVTELVRETAEDFRAQASSAGLALRVAASDRVVTRTDARSSASDSEQPAVERREVHAERIDRGRTRARGWRDIRRARNRDPGARHWSRHSGRQARADLSGVHAARSESAAGRRSGAGDQPAHCAAARRRHHGRQR